MPSTLQNIGIAVAVFMSIQFILILFALICFGAFGISVPATLTAICSQIGVTTQQFGIDVVVLGTLVNIVIMFLVAVWSR